MKRSAFAILIFIGLMISSVSSAYGMDHCGTDECCCSPFGSYCKGAEWGWYGARRSVNTVAEAQKTIIRFFLPQKVSVSNIKDGKGFFEAEVRGEKHTVLDKVIVDKRTGRIRSIY